MLLLLSYVGLSSLRLDDHKLLELSFQLAPLVIRNPADTDPIELAQCEWQRWRLDSCRVLQSLRDQPAIVR